MKNLKLSIILIALLAIGSTLSSCGDSSKCSTDSEQTTNKGKEYTSAYVCPMHCEGSGSDQAGQCPVCNMDYVKNEAQTYVCPMHPEVTGMEGDKCSKCGMDLKMAEEHEDGHNDEHEGHNH